MHGQISLKLWKHQDTKKNLSAFWSCRSKINVTIDQILAKSLLNLKYPSWLVIFHSNLLEVTHVTWERTDMFCGFVVRRSRINLIKASGITWMKADELLGFVCLWSRSSIKHYPAEAYPLMLRCQVLLVIASSLVAFQKNHQREPITRGGPGPAPSVTQHKKDLPDTFETFIIKNLKLHTFLLCLHRTNESNLLWYEIEAL